MLPTTSKQFVHMAWAVLCVDVLGLVLFRRAVWTDYTGQPAAPRRQRPTDRRPPIGQGARMT